MKGREAMKQFLYKSYRFFYLAEQWRRRHLTLPGLILVNTVVIVAILGMDTHKSMIYQAFTWGAALLLLSFLWTRRLRRLSITAIRKLPPYAMVGHELVYRITIENRSGKHQAGLSLYENTTDPRPALEELMRAREPGEAARNIWDRKILYYRWLWLIDRNRNIDDRPHAIAHLAQNGRAETQVAVTPKRRGYIYFTGIDIARSDPLGLFNTLFTVPVRQKVLVLPKQYRLPPIRLPGARRYHSGSVNRASSVGNQDEFISLRDYRPGDAMRHIHWRSTAKRNEPIIKEYQDEYFVRHALILDTFSNQTCSDTFEEAVSVAASFVGSLQTQESFMDLLFVGDRPYRFSAGRGISSANSMLEILAAVQTCTDKAFDTLAPVLFQHVHLFSSCICILLGWDDRRQALIRDLRAMKIPLWAIVIVDEDRSTQIDPGPMRDQPDNLFALEVGRIEAGMAG